MSQPPDDTSTGERRQAERLQGPHLVTVRIPETCLSGPSQNISSDGLYLLLEAQIEVEIGLGDETRRAKIVRIDPLREDQIGLAIRFI